MRMRVPLARPWLGLEEERAVVEVLRSGWISQGPRVEEFERQLSAMVGSPHVLAVNSGTSALLLALRGFGVGPGDSVVVPAYTCAATALPVLAAGATLRFADIDLASFNVTWETIEGALHGDTKAVIVAHMFGRLAQTETILSECRRRGVILIEDAALAFGARREGRWAGAVGDAGCFSFHPRKILTTGEGGAVCTADRSVAAAVASDRSYGASVSAWARHQHGDGSPRGFARLAFNMKLTDLQAAVGVVQLSRLSEFLERRRAIAGKYVEGLGGIAGVGLPSCQIDSTEHAHQAAVIWRSDVPVDELAARATEWKDAEAKAASFKDAVARQGVAISESAQFLPELEVFRGQAEPKEELPRAYLASRLALALPMHPGMSDDEVECVVHAVREAAGPG